MFNKINFWQKLLPSFLVAAFVGITAPVSCYADASLIKRADQQISIKKYKVAIRTLTKAMNSGDLSSEQMALALYKRGEAFNGAGRYSSAIADLTGSIWLGKLDIVSQKEAYRQRANAYQATGHKKLARRDMGKVGQRAANLQRAAKTAELAGSHLPIPSFNTVVRAAKKSKSLARTQAAAKPAVPKKAVIPAFRTSIATE